MLLSKTKQLLTSDYASSSYRTPVLPQVGNIEANYVENLERSGNNEIRTRNRKLPMKKIKTYNKIGNRKDELKKAYSGSIP